MPLWRGRTHSIAVALTLALGVAALTAAFGIVNAALFRQPPFEHAAQPAVYLRTGALLLAVSALACLVPAWRATRADPLEALRAE